jgi:predicted homoserine dehydrogenase-like protein
MSKLIREAAKKLDVRQFKLINGEAIVACVVEDYDKRFELEGPLEIYESMTDGEYSIGFRPWLSMSIETNLTILKTNVIASVSIDTDNKESYLSAIVAMAKNGVQDGSIEETISGNQTIH